jgi:uncharacterized HAD superfamily protein
MKTTDTRPIIALDIDDVLSRTAETIIEYGNEHWDYGHTLEDFNERVAAMWQVDQDEAERRWAQYMTSGNMERYDVIADAKEVLAKLQKHYRIIAVTSRRESLMGITREWINSNYTGLIESVVSSKIYGEGRADAHQLTKAAVLQEMDAAYLIDDQPKHCLGAAEVNVQAVLFGDYPWNRALELPASVSRCKDWQAVWEYFDGRDS